MRFIAFAVDEQRINIMTSLDWMKHYQDPLNETVGKLLKSATGARLPPLLWEDQSPAPTEDASKQPRGKSGSFRTVSSIHRASLGLANIFFLLFNELMNAVDSNQVIVIE